MVAIPMEVIQQNLPVILGTLAALAFGWFVRGVILGVIKDTKMRKIPSPNGRNLPFLGHALMLLGGSPWDKMRFWAAECKVVQFNLMGQRVVFTNEPKLLKRFLLTNQRNYKKDIDMSYKPFMCLLGNGLVTAEGEHWRKGRLLLSTALRIDILDDIPHIAIAAFNRLKAKMEKGDVVDLNEEYRHLTLQVISEAAVSFTPEEGDRVFARLYLPIVHECNARVWEPYRPYLPFLKGCRERNRCLKELNAILCDTIRKRWAQRQEEAAKGIQRKQDIMDKVMSQFTEMKESTVCQLRDDVKTMLLAGHETSAGLLTWATYEVMRHPEIRKELVAEATEAFGPYVKSGTIPPMEVVKKLRWAPAILRESMRLHPPVPATMRQAITDDFIPAAESGLDYDITIPKGATVGIGIHGAHMREDLFPRPTEFIPQRMLDSAFDEIDPYAYLPFINGPRNCLGQHLAFAETQIVLSYMFLTVDLQLPKNSPSYEEIGVAHDYIVPTVPKLGLNVTGLPRSV